MKLEFIRLDCRFTVSTCRLDSWQTQLSDRTFHISCTMTGSDQTVRLILREIDHYI